MKKAAVIALALMLVLPLGACGGKKESTEGSSSTEAAVTESEASAGTDAKAEEADSKSEAAEAAPEEADSKSEAAEAAPEETDSKSAAAETVPEETDSKSAAEESAEGPDGNNADGTTRATAEEEEVVLPYIDNREGESLFGDSGSETGGAFHTTITTMNEEPEETSSSSDEEPGVAVKEEPEDEIEVQDVPDTPDGLYRLTRVQDGDVVLEEQDIKKRETEGVAMYVRFEEDGKLTADLFGEESDGYWLEDKEVVFLDGSMMPYTVDRQYVTLKDGDMTMRFTQIANSEELKEAEQNTGSGTDTSEEESAEAEETGEEAADDAEAGAAADDTAAGEDAYTEDIYGGYEEDAAPTYEISPETALDTTVQYPGTEESLFWQNNVTIDVTGYDPFAAEGFKIKVHCENNNFDDTRITIKEAAVNDCMFDPNWQVVIPALDNLDSEIIFPTERIRAYGLTSFDDILMEFRMNYTYDWTEYAVARTTKEIYPSEAEYGEINPPERVKTTQEKQIVDDDKFTFIVLSSEDVADVGYVLHVYLENKTGVKQMFYWDDVKVNGILADPFWSDEVLGGMRMYTDIIFPREMLTANGISAITGIEFTMGIFNNSDWLSYDMYTETLKYRP